MDARRYKPIYAWRTFCKDVILITPQTLTDPSTYRVTVKPTDINDIGSSNPIEVGMYLKDFVGHTYRIIGTNTSHEIIDYGLLYNWFSTQGVGSASISSSDLWVVPSKTQFETLLNYSDTYSPGLGGWPLAGGKLKETGIIHWNTPNTGATDVYSFGLRAGGYRAYSGSFFELKTFGELWTSTAYDANSGYYLETHYNTQDAYLYTFTKKGGIPVRFLRTSTTLTHGQTGTYTGNDGVIYPTICIGTQEWVAVNISETKYRDGSLIPNITDNIEWQGLITSAYCFYV